jgi:hypothetical protein
MLLTVAAVAYRLDLRSLGAGDPDSAALAWIIIAMDYDQSGIATTYDEARALNASETPALATLVVGPVDRASISLVVDFGWRRKPEGVRHGDGEARLRNLPGGRDRTQDVCRHWA